MRHRYFLFHFITSWAFRHCCESIFAIFRKHRFVMLANCTAGSVNAYPTILLLRHKSTVLCSLWFVNQISYFILFYRIEFPRPKLSPFFYGIVYVVEKCRFSPQTSIANVFHKFSIRLRPRVSAGPFKKQNHRDVAFLFFAAGADSITTRYFPFIKLFLRGTLPPVEPFELWGRIPTLRRLNWSTPADCAHFEAAAQLWNRL